jgi:hypothetical protein
VGLPAQARRKFRYAVKKTTIRPLIVSTPSAVAIKPVTTVPFELLVHRSNILAATELAITNASLETNMVAAGGNEMAEQNKYPLLRELRALAAKDPEGALAAVLQTGSLGLGTTPICLFVLSKSALICSCF